VKYHMKRQEKEVKDSTLLRKMLKQTKYVTIAMAMNNHPYLVSLNHGYDPEENCIYFHCAKEGKKIDYMRANSEIWGQALLDFGFDSKWCTQSYDTVMFKGRVSFVEGIKQKQKAFLVINSQLKSPPERLKKIMKTNIRNTAVGRIDIESLSGKKSKEVTIT